MLWSELYNGGREPLNHQITMAYSCCSMDNGSWKGWNVKYKKSGKSLCTLYPKQGYFVALIAVGANESAESERLIPFCNEYTQKVYRQAIGGGTYKSLAIHVTNENILHDAKNLIALRADSR